MDMAGNAFEWMEGRHKEDHYMRGGSWKGDEECLRCSYSCRYYPEFNYGSIGLRVVRSR